MQCVFCVSLKRILCFNSMTTGKWLHTYVGGIDNAPGTNGFEDIVFAPPASLVAQAVHKPTKAAGDTTSPPLTWSSATRAGPRGTMALFWSVDDAGKITAQTTAPPNSVATTVVPLAGADPATVTITESGQPVWTKGAYVLLHLPLREFVLRHHYRVFFLDNIVLLSAKYYSFFDSLILDSVRLHYYSLPG